MRAWSVLAPAMIAVGCSSHARPASPDHARVGEVSGVERPEPAEQLRRVACDGVSEPCVAVESWDAGHDDAGRSLLVIAVGGDAQDRSEHDEMAPEDTGDAAADEDTDADGERAEPRPERAFWLGTFEDGEPQPRLVAHRQIYTGSIAVDPPDGVEAVSDCAAAGMELDDNRMVITEQYTCSWNHLWNRDEYRLAPFAHLLQVRDEDRMGMVSNHHEVHWPSLRNFRSVTLEVCGAASPDAGDAERAEDDHGTIRYLYIPVISLPRDFEQGGWKSASMGDCALALDGGSDDGEQPRGFRIHGAPDAVADASMRVVMSTARTLYLEIEDDTWVTSAGQWLYEDHVEIWLGARAVDSYYDQCLSEQRSTKLRQWAVSIGSGKVIPAYGKPAERLDVTVVPASGGASARLAITLPPIEYGALTVVYSDSDDGARQEHLLATSELRLGIAETVGGLWTIGTDQAACVLRDNRLQLELRPPSNLP